MFEWSPNPLTEQFLLKDAIKRTNLGANNSFWDSHGTHHFGGNLR